MSSLVSFFNIISITLIAIIIAVIIRRNNYSAICRA